MKPALRDLAELVYLRPGETLSPETAHRFQQAALRWLRHPDGIELARRLGWGTRQKASDALRDDLLRQPARHQIEDATVSPPADSPPDLARRAALGQFDPAVLAWLQDGFRRHVVDGLPLDVAHRLDRASRKRVRDDALRRAADMLRLGNAGPWVVAGRLLQAVKRHHRMRDAPATMLEMAVGEACTAGVRVPDSQQGLFDIIAG